MYNKTILPEGIEISTLNIKPGDTILVTFDTCEVAFDIAEYTINKLVEDYPDNEVLGVVKGTEIEIIERIDSLIKRLEEIKNDMVR